MAAPQDAAHLLAAAAMLEHAAGATSPDMPQQQGFTRNEKTRFQKDALNRAFDANPLPDFATRQMLADTLGLEPRSVRVWFQNRRARSKLEKSQRTCKPSTSSLTDSLSMSTDEEDQDQELKSGVAQQQHKEEAKPAFAAHGQKAQQANTKPASPSDTSDFGRRSNPTTPLSSGMISLLQHALSAQPSAAAQLPCFLALQTDPSGLSETNGVQANGAAKAPPEHLLSAVQRAAAYSAAMAYQAAMEAGMAEALAAQNNGNDDSDNVEPAQPADSASPTGSDRPKAKRRRSRKGTKSFSWKPLGLPATYKRIHSLD